MAFRTRILSDFPPGTAVKVVCRTHANDQPWAWEVAPDPLVPSALAHRAPRAAEVIATVVVGATGDAVITVPRDPADGTHLALRIGGPYTRSGRYWAVGQVDGAWRRVAFSA